MRTLSRFGEKFSRFDRWIQKRLALIYLIIALPCIFVFSLLTPPMGATDESSHFIRSLEISEGGFFPSVNPPNPPGAWVEGDVEKFALSPLFQRNVDITFIHDTAAQTFLTSSEEERREVRDLGWKGDRVFLCVPTTSSYPATSYAVTAVTLFVCRCSGATLLESFYMGRLANGVVSAFTCALALWLCGRFRFFLFAVLSFPMTLYLQASYSQDAAIINASALVVALLCTDRAVPFFVKWIPLGVLMFCIVAAKIFYAPLYLLTFVAIESLRERRYRALILALSFSMILVHSALEPQVPHVRGPRANVQEQVKIVTHNPRTFIVACFNTIYTKGTDFLEEIVGVLGYLEVPLPIALYRLFFIALLSGLTRDFLDLRETHRAAYIGSSLASLGVLAAIGMGILLIEYVFWSVPGGSTIEGIQGRYFLPLLIFTVAALGRDVQRPSSRDPSHLLSALSTVTCVGVALTTPFLLVRTTISYLYS